MSFTERRFPSDHSIKPRSVECCSDGWPSSLKLSHSEHWVLGHLSSQDPSAPIAQFGWVASFRKRFKNYGGHCALGDLQCNNFFFL